MEFRLLGPLEVRDGEQALRLGGRKQRALLAALLLGANRTVATEQLVDELWGDDVPETAVKMVQIYVSQLRKVLPDGAICTRPPGYALEVDPESIDLHRFERLLAEGRVALAAGDPGGAARLLREALELWRGPALAEFSGEPFGRAEAPRLEELRLAALEERIEADLALGRHADLVGELEALAARHPLRERLRRQLMLALYRSGRHADALAAYHAFRQALDEELGIDPSAGLKELERQILNQDEHLELKAAGPAAASAPAAPAPPPRAGGAPFAAPGLLVGRERELEQLRAAFVQTLGGTGQLVFVSGEPGLGKTTLVQAFLAEAWQRERVLVGVGQCVQQRGAGEAYLPVLEALGRICRGPDGSEIVRTLAVRAPTWLAQLPWLIEAEEVEELRRRSAGATQERMLREAMEALEAIASTRPLVLVLEDLHWSDPSTIDLLRALALRSGGGRLLVLATYRPADASATEPTLHRSARELRLRGRCVEVALARLDEAAVSEYLEARFPGNAFPGGLTGVVRSLTDGNPLFIETLVDAWLVRGTIGSDGGGAWELRAELEALAAGVPESVRELIEQQLEALDPEDVGLLEVASVAGREFSAAAVAAALELAEEATELRCADLARSGRFLRDGGSERWPDGTVASTFVFAHDLFQEVLYTRLPAGRRVRLHQLVGARLERAYGDAAAEIAPQLAQHYVGGGAAEPAVRFLRLAAEQALRRSANREAIELLTRALETVPGIGGERRRDEEELGILVALGNALLATRGYAAPEVGETYARARELCRRVGETEQLFPVLYGLGVNAFVAGRHETAAGLAEEFLELAERKGDPAALVAHRTLGWPLLMMGELRLAYAHLRRVVELYDPHLHRPLGLSYGQDPGVAGLATAAWALWALGYPDQALEHSERAIALARDVAQALGLVYALGAAAMLQQFLGESEKVRLRSEEAIALAEEHGIPLWKAWTAVPHAWARAREGDPEPAIAELRSALAASRATGAAMFDPYALTLLVEVLALAGRTDEALAALDEADAISLRQRERFYESERHRLRGELLLAGGQAEEGEAALRRALDAARAREARSFELRGASSLARLLRETGREEEARALLEGCLVQLDEGFDTRAFLEAETLLEELGVPRQVRRRRAGPMPVVGGAGIAAAPPRSAIVVGRETELLQLRGLLAQAFAGQRRLVFVTGEAGLGKTTLVETFLAEAALDERARIARGHCLEQRGSGEPYMPLLDALGRLCRGPGGDEVVRVLGRVAPLWLSQLPGVVGPEELERLELRTRGATSERMLRELLEALAELAAERPLVLALEDIHWSDPSTLDSLVALASRPIEGQLLVVATCRPADSAPPGRPVYDVLQELRSRGLCVELALAGLTEPAIAEYLRARDPGREPPAGLTAAVHERTGGIPLFVQTLLDAWLAPDGPLTLGASVEELAARVPETLRKLIEQQLSRLEPRDLALLEAASVAGPEFSAAAVAAALDASEDEVERHCAELARAGRFLQERGVVEWPDGTVAGRFGFVHDLHHGTLYGRVPAGVRARFHDRVGRRLEAGFGERAREIAAELATHFVRAREGARAVEHLLHAAEQALRLGAPREALEHVRAGLEVVSELMDDRERMRFELDLSNLLGSALIATEGWASSDAEAAFLRARALADELGDGDLVSRVLYRLATVAEVRGEYERAEAFLDEGFARASPEQSASAQVDSNELMACTLFHQGIYERALEHAETGLSVYDGVGSGELTAAYGDNPGVACHAWAALSLWFLGYPDRARERALAAVSLARDPARRFGLATALGHAAVVAQLREDANEALRWADEAVAVGSTDGLAYRMALGTVVRGWALTALGDPGQGIAAIREGIETSRALGARMDDGHYLALLADACVRSRRSDEGLAAAEEALAAVAAGRRFFYEPELHRLRGQLLVQHGDPDEGAASIRRALELARAQRSRSLELRAALDLVRLGDADARGALADAYASFSEGFACADLRAAGELLGAPPPPAAPAPPAPAPASTRSPVRYARSGELNIAYQVTGEGPIDLVLVPGFVSHLERDWDDPRHAHFLDRLASLSRLIRFDKRGTGLSDRPGSYPDLETRMDDVRAVMDAAGSERAVLFGYSEGGPLSIVFAATHPERVSALVLYGAYASRLRQDDYPWAATLEERRAYADRIEREWGWENDMRRMCPSADEAMADWWGARARAAASPGAARLLIEMNSQIDVRDALPAVHVPTLVLHRIGDRDVRVEEARYLAARIPGARLVELDGADHFVAVDPDQILDQVEAFLGGELGAGDGARVPSAGAARVLKTIFFSDVVGSTETVARLGDRAWSRLVDEHYETVRSVLARYDGEEVDTTGDGVLALFDGPARAVRAGIELRTALARLGLAVRVGIHTGEIERAGRAARGIAVHLAARVSAAAGPSEVLVTGTTRDIVAGSGLEFEDRGEHRLRGIAEPRRLFAVVDGGARGA